MQTKTLPSIEHRALATAMLLLLVQTALAGAAELGRASNSPASDVAGRGTSFVKLLPYQQTPRTESGDADVSASAKPEDVSWPRWRGPNDDGSARPGNYPVTWDPEKVLWKVEVPGRGYSTPVVWNKRIYLTTGANGSDTVLSFDWSGKQVWQQQLGPEVAGKHSNGSGSNPSVATDGSAIFAFFKSGNFAALDLDGSIRWKTNLFERYGIDVRFWDFGTSPVLTKKDVVIAEMHDNESWLCALDKITGEVSWRVSRNYDTPQEGRQGYSTPIVFSHKGVEALLVWGGQHLSAHDAADGKIIWSCGGFNPEATPYWPAVASPVISGTVAVVPFGRADRRDPRLHGIKLGGSGDVTETHRLWRREDTGSFVLTPGAYNGRVYVVRDSGEVHCIDPLTGESFWSGVFPKGKGNFYASPLIAGGHLYAAREDGTIFVLKLGDKFEIASKIDMKEKIIASPAAISGRLLVRTDRHLFCIEDR
ncbi:MAG: PQQ-binding-like beta-propeller repeat protein [Candidatus Hydrogenedentes bacterium]|nr:PQQ-binding-like beta-propeller repeat protein [Candidatus Hydrogenedentota bacterium]